jgi:hypothetical protein
MLASKSTNRFLPFEEARDYILRFNLTSQAKWFLWARSSNRPSFIPYNPSDIYKEEWESWMDWLDTKNTIGAQRIYTVNHDYFKKWSRNMAYILGFWWSDGCIWVKNGNYVFSITQKTKEKYILENILKEMSADYLIYEKEYKGIKSCSFNISSKVIVNDILALGGNFRKSLIANFPKYVPKKYLRDFIRGVFDGDGCAYHGSSKSVAYICSGSKKFLVAIKEKLNAEIEGFFVKEIYKSDVNQYRLIMSVNNARRFRDYIYDTPSNLKLIRRYDILSGMGKICLQGHFKSVNFVDFNTAKKEIQKNGIDTFRKYHEWVRNHKGFFPWFPNNVYKEEWKDWDTFLGKKISEKIIESV